MPAMQDPKVRGFPKRRRRDWARPGDRTIQAPGYERSGTNSRLIWHGASARRAANGLNARCRGLLREKLEPKNRGRGSRLPLLDVREPRPPGRPERLFRHGSKACALSKACSCCRHWRMPISPSSSVLERSCPVRSKKWVGEAYGIAPERYKLTVAGSQSNRGQGAAESRLLPGVVPITAIVTMKAGSARAMSSRRYTATKPTSRRTREGTESPSISR